MRSADLFILILMLLFWAVILVCIWRARHGHMPYVRPIGGIASLEEAVGRATELGRPIIFAMGTTDLKAIQTHASLSVLAYVARLAARLRAPLVALVRQPDVYPYTEEIMREAYKAEGVLAQFDAEEQVRYLSNDSIVYAMSVGRVIEESPAGCALFFGQFDFTSLMMAEPGAQMGVIQIAGDPGLPQIPFFVCTCDYTIIGEEFYAAGAYLSPDSSMRGSLLSQDVIKFVFGAIILVGLFAAFLRNGDPNLTADTSSLTFTPDNWSTPQTVTIKADQDADKTIGDATFRLLADGIRRRDVFVVEADDDIKGPVVSVKQLSVPKESDVEFAVQLPSRPASDVTVAVERYLKAVPGLSVSPKKLVFKPDNWNQPQKITVHVAQDEDKGRFRQFSFIEADDDIRNLVVLVKQLSVLEGDIAAFTVCLPRKPVANVTVAVEKELHADPDLATSPNKLTFTPDNWNVPQTVTVKAAKDKDKINGSAQIRLASLAYPSRKVSVSEIDVDIPVLSVSANELAVPEGGSLKFTVKLLAKPTADVEVVVKKMPKGSLGISAVPEKLTFTQGNWSVPQEVTLSAAPDKNKTDGQAEFELTSTGAKPVNVKVTEVDRDILRPVPSTKQLSVSEEGQAQFTVRLSGKPASSTTVKVQRHKIADADLSASPGELVFTPDNWNVPHAVTVKATRDTDALAGAARFILSSKGLATVTVRAVEKDTYVQRVVVSASKLIVSEGDTSQFTVRLFHKPASGVKVRVARETGDQTVKASPSELTFTPANWNKPQTVKVHVGHDDDKTDDQATFVVTSPGLEICRVIISEVDGDVQRLLVSAEKLTVKEGGKAQFTVRLSARPKADMQVRIEKYQGIGPSWLKDASRWIVEKLKVYK